ncbi:MAG TPA: tetratricopeptide repeat protein [Blastocatellia bacterium]|nr:tetratricopeptide repeat protein [Blastocatellia bacterium]
MRRCLTVMAALAFLIGVSGSMALGALRGSSRGLTAAKQETAADKAQQEENAAYKAWYDVQKDYPKAYPLAKSFVEKYPQSAYAKYLREVYIPQARGFLFNQALQSKNVDEMIKLGNEALAEQPDNLDYLYLLSLSVRQDELFGPKPDFSHAAQEVDYTNKAITLIEGGKVPTVVAKTSWDKNATLAWLYQNLAIIDADRKDPDKALENYNKSISLDPKNAAYDYLECGSIHQTKYQSAAKKYQDMPEADRTAPDPKPEVKTALDDINKEADSVIDCWAHFLALTATENHFGAVRDQVSKVLGDLYKYRHPDAPDGLQKLVDQYRGVSAAPPAVSTPAASAKPASGGAGGR